jgi:hypothetical protein
MLLRVIMTEPRSCGKKRALKRIGKLKREGNGIASASERVFRRLLRVAFVFEPFVPRAVSYYLARRLEKWKQQGLILDYKARTKRLGKFHYKTQIDLDLNFNQAVYILGDLSSKLKKVRRWFNV